jgi:hypothetical protein
MSVLPIAIDAKIAELQHNRRTITATIQECRAGRRRFKPPQQP